MAAIGAANHYPRGIAVLGDYLYVAVGNAGPSSPIEIYRAKKCGGRARLVARGDISGDALVVGGKDLYFAYADILYRYETPKQ